MLWASNSFPGSPRRLVGRFLGDHQVDWTDLKHARQGEELIDVHAALQTFDAA
jgi:hypothetical protein